MAEEQLVGVDIAMYNTMRFQKKCRSGELTDNDFKPLACSSGEASPE